MTFTRIFSRDPRNKLKLEVVQMFAQAFAAQIPKDTFTTAELCNYCMQRRGQPQKAVEEFAAFLKAHRTQGEDPFQYDIHDVLSSRSEEEDPEQLDQEWNWKFDEQNSEDLLNAGSTIKSEAHSGRMSSSDKATDEECDRQASIKDLWKSFPWIVAENRVSPEALEKIDFGDLDLDPDEKESSLPQTLPQTPPNSPVYYTAPNTPQKSVPAASLDSAESDWDEEHHNRVSPEQLGGVSVKLSSHPRLRPVSPRPVLRGVGQEDRPETVEFPGF